MSPPVLSKHPFSRGLWVSLVLHGGIAILLSVKPRMVTLTTGPESGLMRATLIAVPTNNSSTGRPQRAPDRLPQSSDPPRLAKPSPVKNVKSAKSTTPIEPARGSTPGQLVNAVQAPSPPLKQSSTPPQKNIKGSASTPSKRKGKKGSTATPQAATDLDNFFGDLAASPGTGSTPFATPQQCKHYASQIKNAIQANFIQEQGYQGRSCEIALQLAADGTILRAEARQGDRLLCAAALRAVGITERVPKPPDPALYELFKAIVISFEF
jgi:TolA C-terminal